MSSSSHPTLRIDYRNSIVLVSADAKDPELAIETEMPSLDRVINASVIRRLDRKEHKRQDIINGRVITPLFLGDGDGGCSSLAAYRRSSGSSTWAWSKGRRPSVVT